MPHPILFYDGVCGLCNRFVQFVLRRDHNAVFRFAPLQSALAASILARHGANPNDLDTVYVALNSDRKKEDPTKEDPTQPNEFLLSRSNAVLFVLKQLSGRWRAIAFLLGLLPQFLRDAAYNIVVRHRYRIFGRVDVCTLPRQQDRSRFLDSQE
jgi:predicted DCC family thiol-disulfide oxidoreductase YuxK